MFGDDDPEIAGFFANFLGPSVTQRPTRRAPAALPPSLAPVPVPGQTRREARAARDEKQKRLTDGLSIGVAGAAAILQEGSAPLGVRFRSEKAEAFHQMLEEMANDIMENGPEVTVAEEISPRPTPIHSPRYSPRRSTAEGWPTFSDPEPEAEEAPEPPATGSDYDSESDGAADKRTNLQGGMDDEADDYQPPESWAFAQTLPEGFEAWPSSWANKESNPAALFASDSFTKARKVAHSPPPPAATALAASSRLSDLSLAPTPNRMLFGKATHVRSPQKR